MAPINLPSQQEYFPAMPPRRFSARPVNALIPKVTKKIYEKHGFPTAALLMDWPAIAGPELADYTLPERLIWPRHDSDILDEVAEGSGKTRRMRAATLRLRVEGHRALDVQYGAAQLLERINSYFGYRAVSDLKIIQGPVARQCENIEKPAPAKPATGNMVGDVVLSSIEDEGLRRALESLSTSRARASIE